jgi:regulator of sigma E protease
VSFGWCTLLIGGLITVHELGHFVAARLLGIGVVKVSIGFGPPLFALRRGGTEYALAVVPLGGYVRLLGEGGEPVAPSERARAFRLRSPWQRLAVILAGPLANLVVPVLLFAHLYAGQAATLSPTLGAVFDGQPAAGADLRPGDRVLAVDDEPVHSWDELNRRVSGAAGRELRITVERPGQERPLTKYVTPREHLHSDLFGARERVGLIGVAPRYRPPLVGVEPGSAAWRAGLRTFDLVLSVQGRPVSTVADLEPLYRPRSGEMLLVSYLRAAEGVGFASLARLEPHVAQIVPDAVARVGRPPRYDTGLRAADLYLHDVEPATPAATLGLRPGDVLTTLDGTPLAAWELFAQALEERPEDEHTVGWRSADGLVHQGRFRLDRRRALDEYQSEATLYVFGAASVRATETRALSATGLLLRVLGLTIVGRLPATAIGGPILIYQVAGVAAQHGLEPFLVMAALVSLNLGLLNLLPVPLLDGGQASLVIIEALRRRPVSARARERATVIGLALLLTLLMLAARNDLLRHFR